jgi:predicted HD phosphohydrolase
MGFAGGNLATVSFHWSKAADRSGGALPAEILACVIAHEIGHLLLGPNSHSPTGIMKAKWSADELRGAGWGRLLFTPQQAELIRAEVRARSGEQRALVAQRPASQP